MERKPCIKAVCGQILHVLSTFCTTCSALLMQKQALVMIVIQAENLGRTAFCILISARHLL